ncbi:MAG: hypothetical protein ACXABY_35230 [Candidatus Thorarchaeota archaeon]
MNVKHRITLGLWRIQKWIALRRGKSVKPPPGIDDPEAPNYINPEDYGCRPGVISWEYLNATYDATFPEAKK